MRSRTIMIVWVTFLLPAMECAGEDRDSLLALARDGNRAAIQSIRSIEFSYDRVLWDGTTKSQVSSCFAMQPGRYWRRGENYRNLYLQYDGVYHDFCAIDGVSLIVERKTPTSSPSLLAKNAVGPGDAGNGAPWEYLLFIHWAGKLVSYHPFHELLDQPHRLGRIERLSSGKREIHIALSHKTATMEFWFDPTVNYLVSKSVWNPTADSSYRWENDVIQFAEPVPGVFVPTVVEQRSYYRGERRAVVRTVISNLKVNHLTSDDQLRLPGIAGLRCLDRVREVSYKVDRDGKQVGPAKSEEIVSISSGIGAKMNTEPTIRPQPISTPSTPSTPWYVWTLGASAILLLVACVRWFIRRRAGSP